MDTMARSWLPLQIVSLLLVTTVACGQLRRGEAKPPQSLRDIVLLLKDEARAAWETGEISRAEADIASEHAIEIESEALARELTRRVDRDGFIDAYVRWQLLSYGPDLASFDNRVFLRLLQTAPAMVPNPMAEAKAVNQFDQLNGAGPRSARELERIRQAEAELHQAADRAGQLNRPAMEFFGLVTERLGEDGLRPRQWLIARCAATIEAGWSTRDVKGDLTESLTSLGRDDVTPIADRQRLARQIEMLAGREHRMIRTITYMGDGSVNVTFSRAFVEKSDVNKWIERLMNGRGATSRLQASIGLAMLSSVETVGATEPPKNDRALLSEAISTLKREAREARKSGELPRSRPDIAGEMGVAIDAALVGRSMTRAADRDSFVDAYVRWQLTSFDPSLPALDAAEFERLLMQLPPLIDNPQADQRLLEMMNRAVQAGQLGEADQAYLNAALNDMTAQTSRASAMNRPALGLRDWLARAMRDDVVRHVQCGLVRCAALVQAGWDVQRAKRDVERRFERAASGPALTEEDRQGLARQARRLLEYQRVRIGSARIVEGAAAVEFVDTGVYDFDVNRWLRLIDVRAGVRDE